MCAARPSIGRLRPREPADFQPAAPIHAVTLVAFGNSGDVMMQGVDRTDARRLALLGGGAPERRSASTTHCIGPPGSKSVRVCLLFADGGIKRRGGNWPPAR
jgi:hypothetical protein